MRNYSLNQQLSSMKPSHAGGFSTPRMGIAIDGINHAGPIQPLDFGNGTAIIILNPVVAVVSPQPPDLPTYDSGPPAPTIPNNKFLRTPPVLAQPVFTRKPQIVIPANPNASQATVFGTQNVFGGINSNATQLSLNSDASTNSVLANAGNSAGISTAGSGTGGTSTGTAGASTGVSTGMGVNSQITQNTTSYPTTAPTAGYL